jgi:hypothetical protein
LRSGCVTAPSRYGRALEEREGTGEGSRPREGRGLPTAPSPTCFIRSMVSRACARATIAMALCLHTCRDIVAAGPRARPTAMGLAGDGAGPWPAAACRRGGGDAAAHASTVSRLRLRGGGRGHPKATPDEYAAVEGVELTDRQARDLRRHWKRKPEWLEVLKGGAKKLVRTKTILNVMKDRDRLEQKRRKSLPLHLIDLGLNGLAWVRELIGWDTPSRFRPLIHVPPPNVTAEAQVVLRQMAHVLSLEDGYKIARDVRPKLVEQLALSGAEAAAIDGAAALSQAGQVSKGATAPHSEAMEDTQLVAGAGAAEAVSHMGSHTYGEVASDGFAEILALAEPQPGEAFIDLGSGSGKAVVLAAALYPFSKAVGVEFVRALHLASSRIVAAFRDALPRLPLYSSGRNTPPEIDMVLGDLTSVDWPSFSKVRGSSSSSSASAACSVVFAACTCWYVECAGGRGEGG